jgi:hypothetical protein
VKTYFLSCTLAGDEFYAFQYDPETKHDSVEWRMKSSLAKSEDPNNVITFFSGNLV